MQAFTLVPPSQKYVALPLLQTPYQPRVQNVLENDGYIARPGDSITSETTVLFSTEGGESIYSHELSDAIARDARKRNLQWNLAADDRAIVKLKSSKRDEAVEAECDLQNEETDTENRRHRSIKPAPARYTISFADRQEAHRFVRAWHRRPFPFAKDRSVEDEQPPIVNAEIIW